MDTSYNSYLSTDTDFEINTNNNKILIIVGILIILVVLIVIIYLFTNNTKNTQSEIKEELNLNNSLKTINPDSITQLELEKTLDKLKSDIEYLKSNEKTININQTSPNNNQDDVVIYDPIANYDRLKLLDPLVDPRGRTSADQIPTPQVAAQLNFPTQGVIDRYHRVGLLIQLNNDNNDNINYNSKRFDDFYSNTKNTSRINKYNTSSTSEIPKYNGVQIMSSDINDFSTNSIKSKLLKTKKNKKNKKSKITNNKIEGFTNEINYENFSTIDDNSEFDNMTTDFDEISYINNSVEGFDNINNKKLRNRINNNQISNSENGILELIGKKITDNWYKYFTSISIGNKIIKINVHNRNRKELYDGNIVFIKELGLEYRVKIDKMDMIEYNPYYF